MKNLEYFMRLNYVIEIQQIPEAEGGGYEACIPLLGRKACRGDGETIEEAIEDLLGVKKYILEARISQNKPIPEPQSVEAAFPSGRLLLRIPPSLHKEIALDAKASGESINRNIQRKLESAFAYKELKAEIFRLSNKIEALSQTVETTNLFPTYIETTADNSLPKRLQNPVYQFAENKPLGSTVLINM